MSTIIIFVFMLVLATLVYKKWRDLSQWDHFPGLTKFSSLPLIGHSYKLGGHPIKVLEEMRKKYGNIFRLDVGAKPTIFLCDYNDISEAYRQDLFNGRGYHDLTGMEYLKPLDPDGQRSGITTTDGATWRELRKFILGQFSDMGIGKNSTESVICQESENLIEELNKAVKEQGEGRLSMCQRFMPAVNNVLWRILNGRLTSQSDPEVVALTNHITAVMAVFDPGHLSNFLQVTYGWVVRVYNYLGLPNLSTAAQPLRASLEKNIREGRPDYEGTYIERHLAKLDENKNNPGSAFHGAKGMCHLKGVAFDLFLAGTDTTATFIEWCILYMCAYPDVQEKLHAEVKDKVGFRTPNLSDRGHTDYVNSFLEEIMRHSRQMDLCLPHNVMEGTTFKGFHFPKNTQVYAHINHVHNDPSYWSEPDLFKPERYLVNGTFKSDPRVSFFGIGKRRCLGEVLARAEFYVYVVALIQNFKFSFPPGKEACFDYTPGIVFYPKSYEAVLQPRL